MNCIHFLFYKDVSQNLKKCNFIVLALVVDNKSIKSQMKIYCTSNCLGAGLVYVSTFAVCVCTLSINTL